MYPMIRYLLFCLCFYLSTARVVVKPSVDIASDKRDLLQSIVTWDKHSIFVRGERIMLFSGEFHPFRLPVPGLWLDIFQKIKAMGFSAVSFYTDWALLEGQPGHFRADGVFALDQFFDAATEAGIYLIARPGPYINSEASGGGFPGWLQRIKGELRSTSPDYLDAISNYIAHIGSIISKAQITNGGPVILFQPENEYSICNGFTSLSDINNCLNKDYMAIVEEKYRNSGIIVPFIFNDAIYLGDFAPGTGVGAVDIYGFDSYPMGYGNICTNPSNWNRTNTYYPADMYTYATHLTTSPNTPFTLSEFQGGTPDPWGGVGIENCADLLNEEFERVYYKYNYGLNIGIFNLYMTFGGTNWGNLGHPEGYTSYDLGSAITEDRQLRREKYSEAKLEATFLLSSPAYLTASPQNSSIGVYATSQDLVVMPLTNSPTKFYIVRHNDHTSLEHTPYRLVVPTSIGNVSIPQLGGTLTLNGRDSKIHVVDYDVGGINLIYSSAEVFTWKKFGSKSVLILYGGEGETHEFAVSAYLKAPTRIEGQGVKFQRSGSSILVNWEVTPSRRIVSFGNSLDVYLLWRNEAYNYWVLDLPAAEPLGNFASPSKYNSSIIAKAGYLLRSASISKNAVYLTGDVNKTTEVEIITGTAEGLSAIYFNGNKLPKVSRTNGRITGTVEYQPPKLQIPDLARLDWRYIDSLPEIQSYDDYLWTACTLKASNNPRNLTTPVSLYAGDYGYHAGSLLYRGHFTSNGNESTFFVSTQGGYAFAHAVYLNSTYLGSWPGSSADENFNQTFALPVLKKGSQYVITVLMDHLGLNENFRVGSDDMKTPRGILDYALSGHGKSDISWKITGNLGGEQYRDLSRGPINEGSMFAERQGYHLPGSPIDKWSKRSPIKQGIQKAGVGFFAAKFDLNLPSGWDIPLGFVFTNTSASIGSGNGPLNFRCQLYVNGWQFGKYINNIGPQTRYPVPEGILNYNGPNYVALTLWSQDVNGSYLDGFKLEPATVILSGYSKPSLSNGESWVKRPGAY